MTRLAGALILSIGFVLPALSSDDTEDTEFRAELVSIQMLSRYRGKAFVVSVDPRFVAKLKLLEDVARLGKKHEVIAFAIHSPSRDLAADFSKPEAFAGKKRHLKLSRRPDGRAYFLQLASIPLDFFTPE